MLFSFSFPFLSCEGPYQTVRALLRVPLSREILFKK
ncbi:hypothetical protein BCUN_0703 [Bifidobacterium cuniculi]|uniref:Uncharacterized protein n=1 Tax=Bifidobacterium cuniculi TaxID=1688 RepID=A0A087B596_9BIFI|nr:hypothetical protein BCUN_0703 [Bifidobacterium cuniculi]